MRRGAAAAAVLCAVAELAFAAPVSDPLARPAVLTNAPARAVLLSAAWAGHRLVAVGERGIVALSDDGGRHWQQAASPVSVTLTTVRFADERHGIVVGHGGTVLTTDDGGRTWTRRLDGRALAQQSLKAAKATGDATAIRNAERLVADGPDKPLLDVLVQDARRYVVVGAYGVAFATEDGGQRWTSWSERLDNPKGLHLYAIRNVGNTIVLAGEQGLLLRSDDGGGHFVRLSTPYNGSWFTAEMRSADDIVLAGLRGNVWHSTDGGRRWNQVPNPIPAAITASARRNDGTLLLASQAGFVLALPAKSDALQPLNSTPLPPLNGLAVQPDGAMLGLSIQGAMPLPPPDVKPAQGSAK
jgi:photosystem II stability/assembly factor-like uncharacterized protein